MAPPPLHLLPRTPLLSAAPAADGGGDSGASGGHLLGDAVRGSLLKAMRSLLEATGEPLQGPAPRGLPSSLTEAGGQTAPGASLAATTVATTELREMTQETLMNGVANGPQDQLPFALIKAIVLVIVVTILLLSTCKLLFKVMTSSPMMRDMKD
ncbi:unnamed protein product [Lampetra planeri]